MRRLVASILLALSLFAPAEAVQTVTTPRPVLGRVDSTEAVFNAGQDGAKCDGTTDDAAAINTTLGRIRARSTLASRSWPVGHVGRLVLPGGTCLIKSTLNATGLYGSGFIFDGSGAQIDCQTSGTPCVDGTGTGQAEFRDLNIYGDTTATPNIGLMLSRLTTSLSSGADHNKVLNPTIVGTFTLAAYYARSTETTHVVNAFFTNYAANAYGAIWDGSNYFNVQSALSGTSYTQNVFSSNNENTCTDCIVEVFGSASTPLWIGGTDRHKFINSYVLSTGGSPAVILSYNNNVPNDFLYLDIHAENTTLTSYLLVTGAATPIINGLSIEDHAPFQSGPLFKRDTGVTSVSLYGANLKIGSLGGTSPSWWDTPSAWAVTGNIYAQNSSSYTAPGSFTGNYCIQTTCTVTYSLPASLTVGSIANTGGVSGLTLTNLGSYEDAEVPTITFSAPPSGGQLPSAHGILTMNGTPSVGSGGTGYTAGDVLTITGGTCTTNPAVKALSVSGGVIATYQFWIAGSCTVTPALGSAVTGGTGSGATIGIDSWKLSSVVIDSAGAGYATRPTVSFSAIQGPAYQAQGTASLSATLTMSAGNGNVLLSSTGVSLGIAGSGGAPVISTGALIDNSGVRQALGSTYTVPANTSLVRFTQTGTLAASTVTLPTALADGQAIQFVNYAGTVTALTFSPAVNGWTNASTLAANTGLRVRWDSTAAAWYREQ